MNAVPLFSNVFFFQAEVGIRAYKVTGVQTCALPISSRRGRCYPLGDERAFVPPRGPGRSPRAQRGRTRLPDDIQCAARPDARGAEGPRARSPVLRLQGDAGPPFPRPALRLSGPPRRPRSQRARGGLLVRSHHGRSEETRLNSSHLVISYAVFCLKKKKKNGIVFYYNKQKKTHTKLYKQRLFI